MVEYSKCPKCNRKSFYLRTAFGSWRCAKCSYTLEDDNELDIKLNREANYWWNLLTQDKKIQIYLLNGKN